MSESRVIITAQAEQAIREFDRLRAQATGSLRAVGELGGKLDSIQSSMASIVQFAAGGITVGAFVNIIKGSIDTLDNLKDLSVTTNIAIEDLAGLGLASKKSGADLAGTADVISKLAVNMGKNSEKFKRLGITAKEPLEAFKQYADIFNAIKDPQLQMSLSAEALGKSWKTAAPLLSEGSEKIGEMIEEGKKLSNVTKEAAHQADEFNDQIATMGAVIDGAKMKLASDMVPALTEVSKAMLKAWEESGKLKAIWVALGALGALAFTDEFSSATVKIKNLRQNLSDLETDLDLSKNAPAVGFVGRMMFGNTTDSLEKQVANTKAKIKSLQDILDKPAAEAKTKEAAAKEEKARREQEKSDAAAAAKATEFLQLSQANTKAAADAALAMRKASADSERAVRAEALADVAEMNRQGLASDAQLYAAKRQALLAAGAETARIKSSEIAALRSYAAKDVAEQIAINGKVAALAAEKNEALRASLVAADALQKQYIFDSDAPVRAARAAAEADIEAINKEAAALQMQYETYGKLPEAITAATIAKLQARTVALEQEGGYEWEINNNNRIIESLKSRAVWESKVGAQDRGGDLARATQLLDVMTSLDDVARSAADGMAASFGKVGSAIGSLTTALTGYGRAQAAIAADLEASRANAKSDPLKIKAAEMKASQASANAQIRQYADMASAAKGFFKEGSKGYKAMEGAEKAYRAVEMAMAIQSMIAKSGLLNTFTGLFVASKQTEVATTVATVAPVVAAEQAKGLAAATVAVANQGKGDPYTAWGRIAAMAAVMTALGFAVSGGGGKSDTTAADRQAAAGTGSILGDSSAKSDSIAKSVALAASNSNIELSHTAGMLRALLNIESSIGNLGGILVRSGAVSSKLAPGNIGSAATLIRKTGSDPATQFLDKLSGGLVLKISDKIANFIFGGKVTTLDTGVTASKGALGSLLSTGVKASQYTDTKKDGGLFHSDKYNTSLSSLGAEANDQFTKVLANTAGGIKEAGILLGLGGDQFNARLNSFVVDFGKISTTGLKAEEIQKQLEAVFSKTADDMARWAVGGLMEFQKQGEGAFETLTRVATNYANVDSILQSVGMSFGAVGLSSIPARENLIDLAGGIDNLAQQTASFAENYLTQAERLAPVAEYVAKEMAAMGLASIDTRDEFKNYVLGLKLTGQGASEEFVKLMALEGAFAKVHAATEDLTMSQQDIADERKKLQDEWDELTMTSAQLQAKALLQYNPANRAFAAQIVAQRELKQATEASTDALKSTIDRLTSAKAGTIAYRDSLMLGSLSTLTPMQKYLETQRQYSAALEKANASPADSAAQSGAQSAATAFLTASQVINASSAAYLNDKSKVLGDMTTLAAIAGAQLSDAQQQLSRLDAQVAGIDTLNKTALEIQQALQAQAAVPAFDPQRYAAAAGTDALVAEIKAQREQIAKIVGVNEAMLAELKLRREEAASQAGDIAYETQEMGATVAKNVWDAVGKVVYSVNNPTRVATR